MSPGNESFLQHKYQPRIFRCTAGVKPFRKVGHMKLFNLALVAAQRGQLQFKGSGDIRAVVHVFRSPEQHFLYLVRLKALLKQVREGKVVAG